MYACPTQEWYVYSVSYPEKDGIQDSLQAAALRILIQHSGLAGLSSKYSTTIWVTVAPSTSQGKWIPSPILTTYAFQFNFGDSDSRYMTASGPSPVFKEIGSKYDGPIDIGMIPIWRGGTLSFIACLSFRVRFFSFILLPKPSHPQKLTEYII